MSMITEYRIRKLKAMHEMMLNVDDESYYMTWIYTVPDCPSEYDFEDIAEDVKIYNEVEEPIQKINYKSNCKQWVLGGVKYG